MIINIKNNKILIDDEDYELVKDKIIGVYNGYVSVSKTTGYKRLHRLVMKVNDPKIHIDHINHNRLDNIKNNLRPSNDFYNTKHRKSKNSNNTSGYRNVSHDSKGKLIVQLQDENGKNLIWRGFSSVEEAGVFAAKMREQLYGEYKGNN